MLLMMLLPMAQGACQEHRKAPVPTHPLCMHQSNVLKCAQGYATVISAVNLTSFE